MKGIDMNTPIQYKYASLRFFEKNEYHISRFCKDDVLLLVYEGILCFTENGIDYEITPGKYHIQHKNSLQGAKHPSDSPKYLYVHFHAHWSTNDDILPFQGDFNFSSLKQLMEELDFLSHNGYTQIEQTGKFYEILSTLYQTKSEYTLANQIAKFIQENYAYPITLDMLSSEFHFSKNHIINIFKAEYNMTPFQYITDFRIKQTMRMIEVTSKTLEHIAFQCGFNNYAYFYKLFFKSTGISPKQWRMKKRIAP